MTFAGSLLVLTTLLSAPTDAVAQPELTTPPLVSLRAEPGLAEVTLPRDPPLPGRDRPATHLALPLEPGKVAFGHLPAELLEGSSANLGWRASRGVATVALTATCRRVTLGGRSRGEQSFVLQKADGQPEGEALWQVPWLDTIEVAVRLKGVGVDGEVLDTMEARLPYRAAVLADRREDGILVWLSSPHGQRLYLQRDGKLVQAAICSGAVGSYHVDGPHSPRRLHDHYGVFLTLRKAADTRSSINRSWRMRYCMTFHEGHAVHATTPSAYRHLGRGASHGCVRLHLVDAKKLYAQCPVGTRVEIF
jgi:hypothetical protein